MATNVSLICFGGRAGKTVTISNATPAVVSLSKHGLRNGTGVVFSTTGALPTGITAGTTYYARWTANGTFNLYDTAAHAIAGGSTGRVNTSSAGSGTHTVKSDYWVNQLDATAKARYGSSGSERAYDGLNSWYTARNAATAATDIEYCEVGMAWDDITSVGVDFNLPCAQTIIWSKVDGVRTAAFTGANPLGTPEPDTGQATCGYVYLLDTYFVDAWRFNGFRTTVDGLIAASKRQNVTLANFQGGVLNELTNYFLWGLALQSGDVDQFRRGAYLRGTGYKITNGVALGHSGTGSAGFWYYDYTGQAAIIANNIAVKNATGFKTDSNVADTNAGGWMYNNISVGNTTNWSTFTATYYHGAGYNFGASGNTPWYKGTDTGIKTMTTSDFLDYTGNDFRPASSSAHQVDAGTVAVGVATTDAADGERPRYNNGATEVWDGGAFEFDFGYTRPAVRNLNFTGLVAGMKLVVFTTNTQTALHTVASTGTTETHDFGADMTVDYTIIKAGKILIRETGVVLSTTDTDRTITVVDDQNYVASSGLTWGTNATVDTANKYVKADVATSGRNLYSFLVESFRDQSALANKSFDFEMNGPGGLILKNGYETRGYTTAGTGISNSTLDYLRDDGLMYLDTGGTATAIWPCITTQGVPTGVQARYQQADGSGTTNAVSTGDVNQLVQAYGDSTHGAFDKRDFMEWKVQADGYDEAAFDVVSTYGTLEGQGYVVPLVPVPNDIAAATITGITLTDHGASPVTWNGKVFSLTLTDTTDSHTGTEILQWVRGQNNFNYHDLVQKNGSNFKTVRGAVFGDSGSPTQAALKGVRVVRSDGSSAHTAFDLFTADDGTTYSPPEYQSVTVSGLTPGSRIQLYDNSATPPAGSPTERELYNDVVAGTSYTWVDPLPASAARDIRLRVAYCGYTAGSPSVPEAMKFIDRAIGTCAASGADRNISYLVSQEADTSYNTSGIDGSTVTGLSVVVSGGNLVKFVSGGPLTISWQRIYAYQVYWQATATGIAQETAFIDSPDAANFLVSDFQFENEVANTIVTINNGYGADAATGTPDPLISTTVGKGVVNIVCPHAVLLTTGSGPLTAGQSAELTAAAASASAAASSAATAAAKITEVHRLDGLEVGTPVEVTSGSRTAGDITQTIISVGDTVTLARV